LELPPSAAIRRSAPKLCPVFVLMSLKIAASKELYKLLILSLKNAMLTLFLAI
jgi:hypothetical protein